MQHRMKAVRLKYQPFALREHPIQDKNLGLRLGMGHVTKAGAEQLAGKALGILRLIGTVLQT